MAQSVSLQGKQREQINQRKGGIFFFLSNAPAPHPDRVSLHPSKQHLSLPFLLQWERLYRTQCHVMWPLREKSKGGMGLQSTCMSRPRGHFVFTHGGHLGVSPCHQPLGGTPLAAFTCTPGNCHQAWPKARAGAGQGARGCRAEVSAAPLWSAIICPGFTWGARRQGLLNPNCSTEQLNAH